MLISEGQKGATPAWPADLGAGVQTCLSLLQDPMEVTDGDMSTNFSGQTSQQYQERMKIQAVEDSRTSAQREVFVFQEAPRKNCGKVWSGHRLREVTWAGVLPFFSVKKALSYIGSPEVGLGILVIGAFVQAML